MTRKARAATAEVVLRFRVPIGATAEQCKRLIWNNLTGTAEIFPDHQEAEIFGDDAIKPKAVSARVIRPRKKS